MIFKNEFKLHVDNRYDTLQDYKIFIINIILFSHILTFMLYKLYVFVGYINKKLLILNKFLNIWIIIKILSDLLPNHYLMY